MEEEEHPLSESGSAVLQKYITQTLFSFGAAQPSLVYPTFCPRCKRFSLPMNVFVQLNLEFGHLIDCVPLDGSGKCIVCKSIPKNKEN